MLYNNQKITWAATVMLDLPFVFEDFLFLSLLPNFIFFLFIKQNVWQSFEELKII